MSEIMFIITNKDLIHCFTPYGEIVLTDQMIFEFKKLGIGEF
jgi:hypothetical protein